MYATYTRESRTFSLAFHIVMKCIFHSLQMCFMVGYTARMMFAQHSLSLARLFSLQLSFTVVRGSGQCSVVSRQTAANSSLYNDDALLLTK